jgi:hypothetical protein
MRAMLEWLEVSLNALGEKLRRECALTSLTPHPDPLP